MKMDANNPKLDVVNINASAKFGHLFILKILNRNEIVTSFKGRNSVKNDKNWMLNNPKLDVVNINACAKFRQHQFLHPQDIERKRKSDVIQATK